jgi:environmental stress-induced protein Ves
MSPKKPTLLTPADFRRVPWKNGGGISTTIASAHRDEVADNWTSVIWQFGRTGITASGPFSNLSGYERLQVVVEGCGLVLESPNRADIIDLRQPLTVVRYDGGLPLVSRLENGPVEVVNLIACRSDCRADLAVLTERDGAKLPAAIHVAYAPSSASQLKLNACDFDIPHGHALLFDGAPNVICVSGTMLIASVTFH